MTSPTLALATKTRLVPIGRTISKVVRGGAWLFAAASIALLGYMLATTDWSDSRTWWALLYSTCDDEGQLIGGAWGLSYHGCAGCVVGTIEEVALLAAVWLSVQPAAICRRISLCLLLGWATLWLVDGVPEMMELVKDDDFIGVPFIFCVSVLPFLFTAGRTALCWNLKHE